MIWKDRFNSQIILSMNQTVEKLVPFSFAHKCTKLCSFHDLFSLKGQKSSTAPSLE